MYKITEAYECLGSICNKKTDVFPRFMLEFFFKFLGYKATKYETAFPTLPIQTLIFTVLRYFLDYEGVQE